MIVLGLSLGMIGLAYSLVISSIIKAGFFVFVSRTNIMQTRDYDTKKGKNDESL